MTTRKSEKGPLYTQGDSRGIWPCFGKASGPQHVWQKSFTGPQRHPLGHPFDPAVSIALERGPTFEDQSWS
jgi:hypothetical protein